mmetsp:Transcript_2955/g.4315  ORF Transcript_2955/g.4315 Transcript_2955/m.4315 type:complete len:271 (-) Transcript_2955:1490-2302(-)
MKEIDEIQISTGQIGSEKPNLKKYSHNLKVLFYDDQLYSANSKIYEELSKYTTIQESTNHLRDNGFSIIGGEYSSTVASLYTALNFAKTHKVFFCKHERHKNSIAFPMIFVDDYKERMKNIKIKVFKNLDDIQMFLRALRKNSDMKECIIILDGYNHFCQPHHIELLLNLKLASYYYVVSYYFENAEEIPFKKTMHRYNPIQLNLKLNASPHQNVFDFYWENNLQLAFNNYFVEGSFVVDNKGYLALNKLKVKSIIKKTTNILKSSNRKG